MVKVAIFGASGGLAECLIKDSLRQECFVDAITRENSDSKSKLNEIKKIYRDRLDIKTVVNLYSKFNFQIEYDTLILTQSIFSPQELIKKSDDAINREIDVGFTEIIKITRNFLLKFPPKNNNLKNIAIIGSTSSYSGFAKSTTYCAIKHGLVGFIKALNDEYVDTNYRFFLFSMGTMKTNMANNISNQDPNTFLNPNDVSKKIISSLLDKSNIFEPEVLIKRRKVKFI